MPHDDPRRTGWYRLTLAGLLGLVLSSIAGGALLERNVLADPGGAGPDFALIGQAWNLIGRHSVDRKAIRPRRMTYAAITGMVDSLGDTGHSVFLTPRMVRESREQLQGHFPGIGAEVRMRGKQVVVVAPLDGSPAQKAGLRAGDIIFKVDGKDVTGETLQEVVREIRGPVHSKVVLTIRDPGSDQARSVAIVRAVIHVHSVSWHLVPGTRVADVRIADFSTGTAASLRRAIAALRKAGARAVVLDLRNDPGGLLDQAISVASEFLRGGNVLLERDAKGHVQAVAAKHEKDPLELPMAVLVNGGTASAAEIVTGALQDAKRATVVGQKTFGTGTVLNEFKLSDGSALMLAVREWLTPAGHTIWHKGISPSVKVALAAQTDPVYPEMLEAMSARRFAASKDAQLLKAVGLLRVEERVHSALKAGGAATAPVARS